MALTIRNLSKPAQKELDKFLKEDNDINTATKAIQAILEERKELLKRKEELFKLKTEHRDLQIQIQEVREAIKMIKRF